MRPNWKVYAKKAYKQGYERGRRERESWLPARDPPGKTGEYQCVTVSIGADGLKRHIRFVQYDAKRGWEPGTYIPVGGFGKAEIITHWRLTPEFPPIEESLTEVFDLAQSGEKIEMNAPSKEEGGDDNGEQ